MCLEWLETYCCSSNFHFSNHFVGWDHFINYYVEACSFLHSLNLGCICHTCIMSCVSRPHNIWPNSLRKIFWVRWICYRQTYICRVTTYDNASCDSDRVYYRAVQIWFITNYATLVLTCTVQDICIQCLKSFHWHLCCNEWWKCCSGCFLWFLLSTSCRAPADYWTVQIWY